LVGPSVVGRGWTGARYPLTKPVVTAVELRVDHRAPLQPRLAARRYLRARRYSASRLPEVRGRACAQAASASHASCRSDSILPVDNLYVYVLFRHSEALHAGEPTCYDEEYADMMHMYRYAAGTATPIKDAAGIPFPHALHVESQRKGIQLAVYIQRRVANGPTELTTAISDAQQATQTQSDRPRQRTWWFL
jgi:hypothetical protein